MKTRSLKQGNTPQTTALIWQQSLAMANPPVAGTDPVQAGFGPLASCDLLIEETGGGTMDLEVFYYYLVPDKYVRDDTIGLISLNANAIAGIVLTPSAADGIFVSLTNPAGGPAVNVHAQAKYA